MIVKHFHHKYGHTFMFSPNDMTIRHPVGGFNFDVCDGGKQFHLESVHIARAFRGRGYGKEMIVDAVNKARELGAKVLTLWVFPSNKKAIHIYELAGFKQGPCDDYDGNLVFMKTEVPHETCT